MYSSIKNIGPTKYIYGVVDSCNTKLCESELVVEVLFKLKNKMHIHNTCFPRYYIIKFTNIKKIKIKNKLKHNKLKNGKTLI